MNERGANDGRRMCLTVNKLFAHASMLLSILVLVCFVLDKFNNAMDFMTAEISKWLFAVTAIISIISAILTIVNLWTKPQKRR